MRRSVELIRAHLLRLAQILGIMVLVWALAFAVFVVIVGVVLLASVRGWLPSAQRRDKR